MVLLVKGREDWDNDSRWKIGMQSPIYPKAIVWASGQNLLPIPRDCKSPPVHVTLNEKWEVLLDRGQWAFKFRCT